jgi:hypothetical protein
VKNLIVTALCLFALAACDKPADEKKPEDKNTPTTTNASATAATTAAVPAAATPVTIADGDLSTPADFEESAEKAITAKNYKTELSTLEAEVAKE